MKSFTPINARTTDEACTLLGKYKGKAALNAGGTDLLAVLKDNILPDYPEVIINIKTITGLNYIKEDERGLKIGALTRLAEVANSSTVKEKYGILSEAAKSVATPQIRNMCTIGGNLAQHVRCWFYRYPQQIGGPILCLRKGGKICNALAGDNRYHSIFGAASLAPYPCVSHCPANTNIPSYLERVREGDLMGAARIVLDFNPIPAITGRVCSIFCEPECNRSEFDEPVAIRCIERSLGDYILERTTEVFRPPETESGRSIAIIGSGPAGLSAAYYLRRSGHLVTVFERLPEAGGMLLYSIPPYRLPKDVVKKQIQALEEMGIRFEVGVNVGSARPGELKSGACPGGPLSGACPGEPLSGNVTIAELMDRFNAVFLAGGTWKSLKLGVPGEEAQGVHYAIDYLSKINSGEKVPVGEKVIVIGGGSVAIDAARTAKRLGAQEVHLVCLECRDLTLKDRMPAQDNEILEAEEEGVIIHACLGIRKIVTKDGKAVGLETMTCLSVCEPDGAFNPQYDTTCTALSLQADSIIVAIGQTADQSLFAQGLQYTRKGTVSVDRETLETGTKGLFAGGDIVAGPSTVIQAVASGREAANLIDLSFTGSQPSPMRGSTEADFIRPFFDRAPRVRIPELPASERVKSIDGEDTPGLRFSEITTEASRCFNCGCVAVSPSDIAVALIALSAHIVTTKRTIDAQSFFVSRATESTVLDLDELVTEIQIPKPPDGSRQNYLKFTLRKPIDFAIVSVATVITVEEGVCTDARIVLGAVAPTPVRATAAEQALKGNPISEARAIEAAKSAVAAARPLSKNAYKVEIAKSLVKRAILCG